MIENPTLTTAWATVAIAIVTGAGALAACLLIRRGLLEMRRSSNERAKDRRETPAADLPRQPEAMTALQALIARNFPAPDNTSTT